MRRYIVFPGLSGQALAVLGILQMDPRAVRAEEEPKSACDKAYQIIEAGYSGPRNDREFKANLVGDKNVNLGTMALGAIYSPVFSSPATHSFKLTGIAKAPATFMMVHLVERTRGKCSMIVLAGEEPDKQFEHEVSVGKDGVIRILVDPKKNTLLPASKVVPIVPASKGTPDPGEGGNKKSATPEPPR